MNQNSQSSNRTSRLPEGAVDTRFSKMRVLTAEIFKRLAGKTAAAQTASAVCTINYAKGIVSVKFTKKLAASDIVNYAAALRADPAFEPEFAEIVDLREVEEIGLDARQALSLADEVDPFSTTSKRAFITRNSAQVHAARMHLLLRSNQENIRIFESIEEALRWIES
jgi:hypothetical protein